MNIDMLVFGEDWGRHPSSTQHLMRHVMIEQQLVWVNSLGLRRPRLNRDDFTRILQKVSAMMSVKNDDRQTPRLPNQPHIIQPCTLSWPGSQTVRKLNAQLLLRKLRPIINQSQRQPLLWTSLPSAVDVVGKLGERAAVYYCGDDFSALDGVDHQPVMAMEEELARKCDLIITASPTLAEKFPTDKTVVLPHGVDTDLFSQRKPRAKDLPIGPVAGFYGSLAGWFDQALFCAVAQRLSHWTFVLIGPAKTDISALLAQPNVRWLGAKPHHELPGYSQHWDAGLLPFKRNAQINACNPLKLREYLAAGSPVITTDFPALDGYRDLVHISNQADTFAAMIEQQHRHSPEFHARERATRKDRVAQESWQQRARELQEMLIALPA